MRRELTDIKKENFAIGMGNTTFDDAIDMSFEVGMRYKMGGTEWKNWQGNMIEL